MLTVSDHHQLLEGAPASCSRRRTTWTSTRYENGGWSISAIARHVGKDRKTVKVYLDGKRQVGVRAPAGEDAFARYLTYCIARLKEDPHLWATALFDEVC